ncbi:MAG: hypothetical protein H7Z14_07895, partial [Anaerolineae bacterium]|nr:hypothetical protein [Phycisphaerae bacterium]
PPAGWKQIRNRGGDEIVQYVDEDMHRVLTVNRLDFNPPVEMTMHKVARGGQKEHDENGLFEETVDRLRSEQPGFEVDRQEVVQVPTPEGWVMDMGLVAGRYKVGADDNITMIALVRQSPADKSTTTATRVYYSFSMTAGIPRGEKITDDNPEVQKIADTFNQMTETIRLLDQTTIREDQDRRLFRTRSLFVNLTEARIRQSLVPEQWLRLIKNGKDIGYTYMVEETGKDLPRRGQQLMDAGGNDGVLIGVRTRTLPDAGTQVDTETWMWSSFDRKFEKFTNFALMKKPGEPEDRFSEIGSTNTQTKLIKERVNTRELDKGARFGKENQNFDPNQPAVRQVEVTNLEVVYKGKNVVAPPISQQLSPWYLTQGMAHLVPRLVAANKDDRGKTFMFAVYNSDNRALMTRYVDVEEEQSVDIGGQKRLAIPVRDRLGLEGSVTTHYFTSDGKYLGSMNPESKIMVLPADRSEIEKLWKNADLSRPTEVEVKP